LIGPTTCVFANYLKIKLFATNKLDNIGLSNDLFIYVTKMCAYFFVNFENKKQLNIFMYVIDNKHLQGQHYINASKTCSTKTLLPVYEANTARCDDIKNMGTEALRTCSYNDYKGYSSCDFIRNNMEVYNDMLGTTEIGKLISLNSPR